MSTWALCFCGAAAVFFAVLMLLQRSLYAAAVCLMAVLLQSAAFFFFAGAPLVAFLQIMIYAGAVMVLIVVTIMAAPAAAQRRFSRLSAPWPLAAVGLVLPVGVVLAAVSRAGLPEGSAGAGLKAQAAIGPVLFGPYAVATEAVTLLMLLSALALVGRLGRKNGGAA
jgi:NADH-quinone oxidoreductase subunit J